MQEQTTTEVTRMLAPVQEKSSAIERDLGTSQGADVFNPLQMPVDAAKVREEAPFNASVGTIDIIHGFCSTLSTVIHKGKAALLKKSGVGFHQSGFDGFSIRELSEQTDLLIELCGIIAVSEQFPRNDRSAAAVFASELEDFQYCFCGIDVDSIGRSETGALLPAFENFKQTCLQIILKFLVENPAQEIAERN